MRKTPGQIAAVTHVHAERPRYCHEVPPSDTTRSVHDLASSGHRAEAAVELYKCHQQGHLSAAELQCLITLTWPFLDPPSAPHGPLTVPQWVELFVAAGRFFQGPPITLGPHPTLYRAAPPKRAKGMSWCTHREMAERFLPRQQRFGIYGLWQVRCPDDAILAVIHRPDDSACVLHAREVVVNPDLLPEPEPWATYECDRGDRD